MGPKDRPQYCRIGKSYKGKKYKKEQLKNHMILEHLKVTTTLNHLTLNELLLILLAKDTNCMRDTFVLDLT
jgi:hypothetical protein